MHIAVLGTGHMATTLASGFLTAGHTVSLGSRHPEDHRDLAAPVVGTVSALEGADLVVSALQAAFSLATLTPLADVLAGRILLDIGNAVTDRFELLYPNSSLAEKLQAALPQTRVVKSLNTFAGPLAIAPSTLAGPTNVFLSGDDTEAKAVVGSLLVDLGWPVEQHVDLGGIVTARGPEHYFVLFATLMQTLPSPMFNVHIVR